MKTGITHRLMHHKLPRSITFDPTVGFSRSIPFQKQEFKIFPRVSRSTQSMAFWRWRPLKGCWWPYKGRCLEKRTKSIKGPKHPSEQRRPHFSEFFSLPRCFLCIFPLFQTHKKKNKNKTHTHTHTYKHTSKPLDSSLFTKNTRYCSYTQSSKSFSSIYFAPLCLNNTIYWFL